MTPARTFLKLRDHALRPTCPPCFLPIFYGAFGPQIQSRHSADSLATSKRDIRPTKPRLDSLA